MEQKVLMPGEIAGNYNEKWTKTFDLQFLILWLSLFVILLIWTLLADPHLFDARRFFLLTGVKLFVMMILALGGDYYVAITAMWMKRGILPLLKTVGLK